MARTLNSFGLFIVKAYKNARLRAQLSKLPIAARARFLAKRHRALPEADRAALAKEAATIKTKPKPKPKPQKTQRRLSAYNVFVKKNFAKVTGTSPQRMKKLAKLWNTQQDKIV